MEPLDDLLIKRRRGTLAAAERRRLESARRASPEYDLVLLAQGVFERDGSPDPADAERLRELAQAVERRFPAPGRAGARWRTLLRRLAPPLLLAGAAAASIGELIPRPQPAVPSSAPAPAHPPVPSAGLASPSRAEPQPPKPEAPPAEPSRLASRRELPRPEVPRPEVPRPELPPDPPRSAPDAQTLAQPSARAAHSAATASNPESAESLFRRANRLRSVDWSAAAALYAELIRRHPGSNEAGVSEVALGKWSLAQGRSGDALEWFRAHLRRPPGALTAEALFGEARALESIGSHRAARAPWRRLLERYPASPYADVARQRLAP
jgi:TolA-binding protein